MRFWQLIIIFWFAVWAGCGTTRWSDSARTATEQLLVSGAIDRSVSSFDFRALAGKTIFFDISGIKGSIDTDYIASSIRQHALANGCLVKIKPEDADYIAEVRAGAVGTDRHDVLFGIPSTTIPTSTTGSTVLIPEVPLIKKTDQRAVAKLAIFAYNRHTGRPIWQSGLTPFETRTKDVWVFGAGPFQKGDLCQNLKFAGERLNIPVLDPGEESESSLGKVSVATEAYFNEPKESIHLAQREPTKAAADSKPAADAKPAAASPTPAAAPPAAPNLAPPTSVFSQGNGFTTPVSSPLSTPTSPAASQSPSVQIPDWSFLRK